MGLVASNAYLVVFTTGTFVGALSAYYLTKFRRKPTEHSWEEGAEERFEFEDPKDEYRLIMGVRNDLKMQKGKVAAQCGHAAVAAYAKALKQKPKTLKNWLKYGGTKIAVRLDSEEEMIAIDKKAKELDVLSSIIRDAGQTQVAPGSRTVIAIGPAPKSVLDQITGHLKLY
ncbi:peptidyl-tRNA hydrolase 2, mitochondrial-like [Aethina tumida]|uniref:peptidyl-tRNA hydrolase 2, mitochondrial-like n=1 Tax=Aethina tumida TaxID=116153 RepID=UPI00096B5E2A|nr:peptidyl-tRNA hydrolase 2, mitochondrial-like [Aethina tumida]